LKEVKKLSEWVTIKPYYCKYSSIPCQAKAAFDIEEQKIYIYCDGFQCEEMNGNLIAIEDLNIPPEDTDAERWWLARKKDKIQ